MAKRVCDPTSGKIGSQVYMIGRNGQVVRTRVIPANPRSQAQTDARGIFQTASQAWDSLTELNRTLGSPLPKPTRARPASV